MDARPVYHHTGLESTGGAVRVAQLVMSGLTAEKVEVSHSFELAEQQDGKAVLPDDFGRYLPDGAIGHIHSTGDWTVLLRSVPRRARLVITLHDCELFTGGCPYPLDCPHFELDCADPCPRNFPDSHAVRQAKKEQVDRLKPVLTAPSRWMARLAGQHLGHKAKVIPNGIPWPGGIRAKARIRRELGIHPAARVGLFAAHGGMSAAYKSGDAWKDIWQALKASTPRLLCFAVGGDKAEEHGDLVIWPYVERTRLARLMSAADVLLYPTRADNHSLMILEAMSRGLPVVSYEVGGVPEQVTDFVTGRLVPPGDQGAFIEAAHTVLTNVPMLRQLGTESYSAGMKRFRLELMVQAYRRLYGRFELK